MYESIKAYAGAGFETITGGVDLKLAIALLFIWINRLHHQNWRFSI
jgi:hypothetical protein